MYMRYLHKTIVIWKAKTPAIWPGSFAFVLGAIERMRAKREDLAQRQKSLRENSTDKLSPVGTAESSPGR